MKLEVADTPAAAAMACAEWLCGIAERTPSTVSVALAGGSTPTAMYRMLAAPPLAERMPWSRTRWYWGDERFVPRSDARSNAGVALSTFLSVVPVCADQIHPFPTDAESPEAAADAYAATLRGTLPVEAGGFPRLDVVLLGLGDDGHTASLFPGHPALRITDRPVAAVHGAATEPRLTLTFPMLAAARHIAFLVTGSGKQAALASLRAGEQLPAQPLAGLPHTLWFVDADAAEG